MIEIDKLLNDGLLYNKQYISFLLYNKQYISFLLYNKQ